ncbi:MAG TPA: hypothetical protein VN132_00595, partial [Bdellovibrio sp.]|nr:hypothetical protein [Bdellovibrio sp.]
MLRIFLVVFSFFFLFLTESQATPYRRLVNFEWEAIEGAASYEVELKQVKTKGEGKTFKFRVPEAAWNGHLAPGKYILKLRSFDRRGVPGDWNAPSDFNVGLETAVLKYPAAQAQIASKEEETAEVNFEWAPVGGAQKYNFELNSDDGKTKISKELEGTKISLKIPVAASYSWKVSSINEEGIESDAAAVSQFTFLGKPLEAPKLQKPESSFV